MFSTSRSSRWRADAFPALIPTLLVLCLGWWQITAWAGRLLPLPEDLSALAEGGLPGFVAGPGRLRVVQYLDLLLCLIARRSLLDEKNWIEDIAGAAFASFSAAERL